MIVADLAIAVGVYMEIHFGRKASTAEAQLQQISDERVAAAEARAAEANRKAQEAQLALEEYRSPRLLTTAQQERIASAMSPFKGLRAVLGAVPPSVNNTNLVSQLLLALKAAGVDAFINLTGVEASVSPTGASNRGQMLSDGFPNGVNMIFVTGNEKGEAFAKTLAGALNDVNITASAVGGRDENRMAGRLKEGTEQGLTRNDKQFEPVTVVVGDKP
ncbi:MAG TPA: hypothetical protein VKS78_15080 [Roseiarcus sp.]|nr:hypothetical protein [Roseiarcus sp.]